MARTPGRCSGARPPRRTVGTPTAVDDDEDRSMTTRDQLDERPQLSAATRPRSSEPSPAPGLPERLLAARERKGVDLYRAERDTKIRARYLARPRARRLSRAARARSTRRASCATTRSTSGSTPTTSCSQWRRERGDAPRAAGRHRRSPQPHRGAAPGPDVLAEPRRLRAADVRRARVRRRTSPSSSCASPSRRRSR